MLFRFKLRRSTASEWTTVNPVLLEGEPGYELDTHLFKMGDGVSAWNDLPYFVFENAIMTVRHGSNAAVTRPPADVVYWIGTVEPENIQVGDLYFDEGA